MYPASTVYTYQSTSHANNHYADFGTRTSTTPSPDNKRLYNQAMASHYALVASSAIPVPADPIEILAWVRMQCAAQAANQQALAAHTAAINR